MYSIPDEFLPGFALIRSLPDDVLGEVAESLKSVSVGGRRKALIDAIGRHISDEQATEIISVSIFSMGKLISASDADLEKISKGLASAFFFQTKQADVQEAELEALSKKLLFLLSSWKNAKKTIKAIRLLGHNERIYRNCDIVTDIRLIFNDTISDKNRNGVVLHQLKLEYVVGINEVKEFYIALDSFDLQKLKEHINRALEKEQSIIHDYKEIEFVSLGD